MRLEVRGGLDDVAGGDHPAHAPSGHGVGLGHAVEDDRLLSQLGNELDDVCGLGAVVEEVLVDLIGDDPDPVLQGPLADGGQLLGRVDRAGRVRRRAQQQHLGALGAGGLELVNADLVVLVGPGEDLDRGPPGQGDGLGVGGPVGRGQQHLVAGVDECGEGLEDGLLTAVGDQDVVGGDLVAGVAQRLGGDGLAQGRQALGGGVLVVGRVLRGGDGGLNDVVGGGEVGLSGAEADDGAAGGLEGLGLGVDGQSGGGGDGGQAGGNAVRGCRCHPTMVPRPATSARLKHVGSASDDAGTPPGHLGGRGVAPHPGRLGVAHPTACGYRKGFLVWQTRAPLKGSGAIGSAPVSKTGGCGFESRLPC